MRADMEISTLKYRLRRRITKGRRPSWREKMLEIMCERDINPESEREFKREYECGRGWRCQGGYPGKHDSEAFLLGFEDEVHDQPAPKGLDQF